MADNRQPHLLLDDSHRVAYALLPGDPQRVERVKSYLDNPIDIAYNREYKSCRGTYKGVPVLVVSTGIGGASMGIAVEELGKIGVTTLIRIGSCGALQPELPLGSLIIATGAVRDDGASKAYIETTFPAVPNHQVFGALVESAKKLNVEHTCGIVRSHDSFYTDQEVSIDQYWHERGVLGADMETAALFVIGGLRHLKTASILNVVVAYESDTADSINEYVSGDSDTVKGEKNEILTALQAIVQLAKNSVL